MPNNEYTCIVCPISCKMIVEESSQGLKVSGHTCKRGEKHALAEHTEPLRMLTTTIEIHGAEITRIPVISKGEIPKKQLKDCLEKLYSLAVKAPISCGETILEDICGTGIDIVASRTINKKEYVHG